MMSEEFDLVEAMWLRKFRKQRKNKTISGTPPLTFKAKGAALKDYQIYGNDGGVGDLITDETDTNCGKYKIPVTVRGKNLFNLDKWFAKKSGVHNGTFKKYENSFELIATNRDCFTLTYLPAYSDALKIEVNPNTRYSLSWKSNNQLNGWIYVFLDDNLKNMLRTDNAKTNSLNFTTQYDFLTLRFGVENAGDSITYSQIQLEEGSTATDYESYHDPITTNIYLDEPLAEGQSISMSDTGIVIPTINGTNILSVDTTVQPSRVDIKGKIKKLEGGG